jgi:phosphoglycolate phosphatase
LAWWDFRHCRSGGGGAWYTKRVFPRARAVLFDIDGTILTTAGAGKRAMSGAIEEVLGLTDPLADFHLDGMTDRAIVRRAADARRASNCTEREIDAVLERYLARLAESLPSIADYVVLPGVDALARALASRGVAVGLGTGNVERGARLKLERSGLNPVLRFGGFGDDAEDRAALLAVGLERARARCGGQLEPGELWIIGDTPKDVTAGKAIGARVLAVATGRYSVDDLRACGADVAAATLAEVDAVAVFG